MVFSAPRDWEARTFWDDNSHMGIENGINGSIGE